jgi:transposase InsO family protein
MPWYGSRQMARHLQRLGHPVGRRRVRRLMAKMGLSPIYQQPGTSDPHPEHRIYCPKSLTAKAIRYGTRRSIDRIPDVHRSNLIKPTSTIA